MYIYYPASNSHRNHHTYTVATPIHLPLTFSLTHCNRLISRFIYSSPASENLYSVQTLPHHPSFQEWPTRPRQSVSNPIFHSIFHIPSILPSLISFDQWRIFQRKHINQLDVLGWLSKVLLLRYCTSGGLVLWLGVATVVLWRYILVPCPLVATTWHTQTATHITMYPNYVYVINLNISNETNLIVWLFISVKWHDASSGDTRPKPRIAMDLWFFQCFSSANRVMGLISRMGFVGDRDWQGELPAYCIGKMDGGMYAFLFFIFY